MQGRLQPAAQRSLAWSVTGYGADEVREILRRAGARPWQVDLVTPPVLDALHETVRQD